MSNIKKFCNNPSIEEWCILDINIKNFMIKVSYCCIDNNIGNLNLAHIIVKYVCDKSIIYKRGYKDRFGIITKDKSLYLMSSDEKCFQSTMLHSVPKWDNTLIKLIKHKNDINLTNPGPRLSLTFRFLGEFQPVIKKYKKPEKVWENNGVSIRVLENIGYDFEYVYDMIKDNLNPDITKMYGKTFLNSGRQVVTYTTNDKLLIYKYGGKNVNVIMMNKNIKDILNRVEKVSGVEYNWVHIVYYPSGDTKLDWHNDVGGIAKNSTIAGISLFKYPTNIRSVEFKKQK